MQLFWKKRTENSWSIVDCSKWRTVYLWRAQKPQSSWMFKKGLKTIGLTAAVMTQKEVKCRDIPMWSILALCLSFYLIFFFRMSTVCFVGVYVYHATDYLFYRLTLSDNKPRICTHNENLNQNEYVESAANNRTEPIYQQWRNLCSPPHTFDL